MKHMARKQLFVKAFVTHGSIDNVLVYLKFFLLGTYVKTEGPFYNLHCRLITHNSLLQELKTTVDNITKEVTSLKATIAIIGKSNPELHSPRQLKQQGTQQYPQQATQHIEKQDIQTYTCHCACFC